MKTTNQTETKPAKPSAHTPTPWLAEHNEMSMGVQCNTSHVVSADLKENDGWAIATVQGPNHKANAALIVRAVNSHAELCEKLAQFVRYTNNTTDSALALFNREAREILEKAKGAQS